MSSRHRKAKPRTSKRSPSRPPFLGPAVRPGNAKPHAPLVNNLVHIFVDDQNLFWGIANDLSGPPFRIAFGRLLLLPAGIPRVSPAA